MMRRLLEIAGLASGDMGRTARALARLVEEKAGIDAEAHWLWNGPRRPAIVVIAPNRPFERRNLAATLVAEWRSIAPPRSEATFILLDEDDELARSLVARTMMPLARARCRSIRTGGATSKAAPPASSSDP